MSDTDFSKHPTVNRFRWTRYTLLVVICLLIVTIALVTMTVVLAHAGLTTQTPAIVQTAPNFLSYQGRVSANGQSFNGTGYFKFTIVDATGTTAYWSNDGTGLSTAPFTPTGIVTLPVSSGIFNVLLGDTSLAGMTQPITSIIFQGANRSLRVWFNDGNHGFQLLTPDTRLSAIPFAIVADTLDGLDSTELARSSHLHSSVDISDTIPETKVSSAIARDSEIVPAIVSAGFITQSLADARYARIHPNPNQIAMLKWYTAISTTQSSFPVGAGPRDAAFDGERIWVTNRDGGTVSVLRVSDGSPVGNYSVSGPPWGIAYDGVYMWVTGNIGGGTVSVLRARDGAPIMTIPVGSWPYGIAFDGKNMWVTNSGYGSANTISVLRASDGFHVMTATVGLGPTGIAFDGTNMWAVASDVAYALDTNDGSVVMTHTVGAGAVGIAYDGTNLWVTNQGSDTVSVFRASDSTHVMTATTGHAPRDIAFDGVNMWIANEGSDFVTVVRASDGTFVKDVPVGLGPLGLAFDGTNMWVVNKASNSVSKR